jgi:hypothetical protein
VLGQARELGLSMNFHVGFLATDDLQAVDQVLQGNATRLYNLEPPTWA